jgi:hypothetical protein
MTVAGLMEVVGYALGARDEDGTADAFGAVEAAG